MSQPTDAQRRELIDEALALRARLLEIEAQLGESETIDLPPLGSLEPLLRASPAAVVALDPQGRVRLWSPLAAKLFGWREEEVIGEPCPLPPPEQRDALDSLHQRALAGLPVLNHACELLDRENRRAAASLSAARMTGEEGAVLGTVWMIVPAGSSGGEPAAATEAGFQRLLSASSEGAWLTDREGVVTFVNSRMAELLEQPPERIVGRRVCDFFSPDERGQLQRCFAAQVGEGERRCELPLVGSDAGRRWLRVSATPLHDGEGRFAGTFALATDITAHKQAEEELEYRVQQRTAELSWMNQRLEDEIAARRGTEKALRDSEERLRSVLAAMPDLIFVLDADGRYRQIFTSQTELLVRPRRELLGQTLRDVLAPDAAERLQRAIDRALATGELQQAEYEAVIGGEKRRFASRLVSFSPTGEQAVLVAARDVTETRKMQRALRESEQRFRLLAENSTDVVSRHDLAMRFLYASPSCQRYTGYEPGELVGQCALDFLHAEDRPGVEAALHRARRRQEIEIRFRFRHRDGRWIWFETRGRMVRGARGERKYELHLTSRDVTARHAMERRLRLVQLAVEQIDEAVLVTEPELDPPGPRIVYVNAGFTRMTGYAPEEVIGKTPRILQGPRTSRATLDRLRRSLEETGSFEGETVNYRKDGSEYVVDWHVTALRDERGRILHWVAIQRDVTEQKQAEDLARQRQEELAHVGRLSTMGEMASALAHELNQPLAAVSNYAQGCLWRVRAGRVDEKELSGALERIVGQAARAGQIIRRLRRFVRKREPRRSSILLNDIVHEVVELMDSDLRQRRVAVRLQLARDLPLVLGDSVQLEQVVLNLVRNAVEAMEPTPGEQRAITLLTSRHARGVRLAVCDRGPGLSEEQLAQMFHPFYSTKSKGMGMGLAISRSIIESHGGRIGADLQPGGGTCVHLTLPIPDRSRQTG